MSGRGTAILALLVALVAAAYVLTTERQSKPKLPAGTLLGEARYINPSEPVDHLLKFQPSEVKRIRIEESGKEFTIERRDGTWKPVDMPQRIDDFLSSLVDTSKLATIDEGTKDLKEYGLEKPERKVTLESNGGTTLTLSIGDRSPAGTAVYTRVDDGPITLSGALLIWEFDKAFKAASGNAEAF